MMVIVAVADLVVSETEVATIVTVFPVGTEPGAVKVVAVPLPVAVGLNVPHDELPHVTVQFTPALLLSLLTAAVILVVALTASEVGG